MKKVQVWNIETCESVTVDGIDAREYVSTGGWSLSPVATYQQEQEPESDAAIEKQKKRSRIKKDD